METSAIVRKVAISAQKVRLVADLIRGVSASQAIDFLDFSKKKAAKILKKAIESALANAEHNNGMNIDHLRITTIFIDKARSAKRLSPRAKGRSNRIEKQSCHITVRVGS